MFRPLEAEFYRLSRRWMPRACLAVMAGFAFLMYELVYTGVRAQLTLLRSGNAPANVAGPDPAASIRQLEDVLASLGPQHVSDFGVSLVAGIGTIMLIMYAASQVGSEYGWGTLRTLLASGSSRNAFLASKLASIAAFALLLTIVGVVAVTLASYLVAAQSGGATAGLDATSLLSSLWRTSYAFAPYMALASVLALWSRSPGAGIAAGLVIYFTESIVTSVLISFDPAFAAIANLGIARNVQSLSRVAVAVAGQAPQDAAAAALPSQEHAAVVLAVWTALLVGLAFWRLRTRDVTLA